MKKMTKEQRNFKHLLLITYLYAFVKICSKFKENVPFYVKELRRKALRVDAINQQVVLCVLLEQ